MSANTDLRERLRLLEAENLGLVQVVEYYADPNHWKIVNAEHQERSACDGDRGTRARYALRNQGRRAFELKGHLEKNERRVATQRQEIGDLLAQIKTLKARFCEPALNLSSGRAEREAA